MQFASPQLYTAMERQSAYSYLEDLEGENMHSFPSQDYELNAGGCPMYVSSKLQAGRNLQPPQSDYYNSSIGNMQFAPL